MTKPVQSNGWMDGFIKTTDEDHQCNVTHKVNMTNPIQSNLWMDGWIKQQMKITNATLHTRWILPIQSNRKNMNVSNPIINAKTVWSPPVRTQRMHIQLTINAKTVPSPPRQSQIRITHVANSAGGVPRNSIESVGSWPLQAIQQIIALWPAQAIIRCMARTSNLATNSIETPHSQPSQSARGVQIDFKVQRAE